MRYFSIHATNIYGFFICIGLIITSAFFQFGMGIEPCPLCIIQRLLIALLAFIFLIALVCKTKFWLRISSTMIFIISVLGAGVAGRQAWLQYLPRNESASCGPTLSYMLQQLSFKEAFISIMSGSGDCAAVQWQFLGLSMAVWMLGVFILFSLLALINFYRV